MRHRPPMSRWISGRYERGTADSITSSRVVAMGGVCRWGSACLRVTSSTCTQQPRRVHAGRPPTRRACLHLHRVSARHVTHLIIITSSIITTPRYSPRMFRWRSPCSPQIGERRDKRCSGDSRLTYQHDRLSRLCVATTRAWRQQESPTILTSMMLTNVGAICAGRVFSMRVPHAARECRRLSASEASARYRERCAVREVSFCSRRTLIIDTYETRERRRAAAMKTLYGICR